MSEYVSGEDSSRTSHFDDVKQMTIIGRGECGKTSILRRFFRNEFSEEINATPIESEDFISEVGGRSMKLKIWDTSGQDDYSRFRTLTLPISDYIMICYSIIDSMSFYEVEDTLVPMVRQKARESAKIILVATKTDKRTPEDITFEEGIVLAQRIGATKFYECSSMTGSGVEEIFSGIRADMYEAFNSRNPGFFYRFFGCCSKY